MVEGVLGPRRGVSADSLPACEGPPGEGCLWERLPDASGLHVFTTSDDLI